MLTPALEVGGTHVSVGLVDTDSWQLAGPVVRRPLDAVAGADELLDRLAAAADECGAPPAAHWGVAMPDPFDYPAGIGRFHSVGKFEALSGVDVRAGLLARIRPAARAVSFVNDAEAFLLGEWVAAGRPPGRWAALTLGTGVGSGSLVDGQLISAGYDVPPGGRVHLFQVDGRPLEDVMSRRALMSTYLAATGTELDVREIADRARTGDPAATAVLEHALSTLGRTVALWLSHFEHLVVGGSMTRSWDVLGPPFLVGLGARPDLVVATDIEAAALVGAAFHALS